MAKRTVLRSGVALALLLTALTVPALAADAEQPSAEQPEAEARQEPSELEAIVVTGSRIQKGESGQFQPGHPD